MCVVCHRLVAAGAANPRSRVALSANMEPMTPRIHKLNKTDSVDVARFLVTAQRDHVRPVLSEHKAIRAGTPSVTEWVIEVAGEWVAYFQAAEHSPGVFDLEIVTLSGREQIVSVGVEEVCAALPGSVQIWAWTPELMTALDKAGAVVERALLEMQASLPPRQSFVMPDEFELRDFRVADHAEELRGVINRAFADHREAGDLSQADLAVKFGLPWFVEDDVIAAWRGDRLAGICWTKHATPDIGEIYIIGVDPDFVGSGLGKALVSEGLRHQYDRYRVTTGSLWTDEDNERAVGMYRSMGFNVVFRNFAYVFASPGLPT